MLVWKERVLQEEWGEEEDNEDGGDDAGGSGRRRPYVPEDQRLDFRNIYRWTGTYLVVEGPVPVWYYWLPQTYAESSLDF